jgi:hypothetical protein
MYRRFSADIRYDMAVSFQPPSKGYRCHAALHRRYHSNHGRRRTTSGRRAGQNGPTGPSTRPRAALGGRSDEDPSETEPAPPPPRPDSAVIKQRKAADQKAIPRGLRGLQMNSNSLKEAVPAEGLRWVLPATGTRRGTALAAPTGRRRLGFNAPDPSEAQFPESDENGLLDFKFHRTVGI